MISAFVQFNLPQPVTRETARELFLATVPDYRGIPGLIRKYYLHSKDGGTVGGVYLWESQEAADNFYTEAWKNALRERFGDEPTVLCFETPVVVDNLADEVISD